MIGLLGLNAPAMAEDLAGRVADCTGRMSAELAHQWLMRDAGAAETQRLRDDLADVLAALVDRDAARGLMARRLEAKAAHAALLQRSVFNPDPVDAAWAARHAARAVGLCAGLVRGSAPGDRRA